VLADNACFLDEIGESKPETKLRLLNALYPKD